MSCDNTQGMDAIATTDFLCTHTYNNSPCKVEKLSMYIFVHYANNFRSINSRICSK